MGQDGQSASAGNDTDDINSWDEHHSKFYNRVPFWRYLAIFVFIQIILGIPVFIVIHGLHLVARGMFSRTAKARTS